MFSPWKREKGFSQLEEQVIELWREQDTFKKSLEKDAEKGSYVFYEGPPTANGRPGIHHVQARSYKDLFPRFKTMQGFRVERKAGWDCHGLPVELEVEKKLGFSGKLAIEDYGVDAFNQQCRESVFEYEQVWKQMTERIGFWVDLENPYMTLSNDYIESVWWSLSELWKKGLIYQGYKVIPYCPNDGTPLSSHEVSQGYQDVVDTTAFVQFPLLDPQKLGLKKASLLVWTTTPWTLPGNVAAAVHPELEYVALEEKDGALLLASSLVEKLFAEDPPKELGRWKGQELAGLGYEPPYNFFVLDAKAHYLVTADFVTAEDGTGIVHIAPAFGADDQLVGRENDLPTIRSVDDQGKFDTQATLVAGLWFKDADPVILKDLEERSLLWKSEKYEHSYPHCWRCKNPLMYYATDSWFIANTKFKDLLIEKNQGIDWHPEHIKNGRYGDWLNNLVDWALSRTRYWGTPLPIWTCKDCGHQECIGSYQELSEKSKEDLDIHAPDFDPHRPTVDDITLCCSKCQGDMKRVPEVIDCWYDSGAMPFAQLHYPFENQEKFKEQFPADFICEGLDQTRGWFNSLHQLGVMLFDQTAYRSVICHGLVLDSEGEKMSKSRGNVVDPFKMLASEGADAIRWYLYTSGPPSLSRRFSEELVGEASRRYLSTLWNVYQFFVLNANAAKSKEWDFDKKDFEHPLDRWIVALLHQTIQEVTEKLENYQVTPAARKLEHFLDHLSNWYVRRSRRRFWEEEHDAFVVLYLCLWNLAHLSAPFTPFISEVLYQDLKRVFSQEVAESVHLSQWPTPYEDWKDEARIEEMELLMQVTTVARSARNESGHRIRQPLQKLLVRLPVGSDSERIAGMKGEILQELNVKELEVIAPEDSFMDYRLKPNLPVFGKKFGKLIPAFKKFLGEVDARELVERLEEGPHQVALGDQQVDLTKEDLLIEMQSPEGYAVAEDRGILAAFTTELTADLIEEGMARDLVRHIQELRKKTGLEISDTIEVWVWEEEAQERLREVLEQHRETICSETLAQSLELTSPPEQISSTLVKIGSLQKVCLGLQKK